MSYLGSQQVTCGKPQTSDFPRGRSVIITRIRGGLGNQMFQYAAARRLAKQHATDVKLHLWLDGSPRRFGLSAFRISSRVASPREVGRMIGNGLHHRMERRLRSTLRLSPRDVQLPEKDPFQFDPEALKAPGDVYMYGYWQSEKYFSDAEPVIRTEFQLTRQLRDDLHPLLHNIENENAVSLHIRRGDYVVGSDQDPLHYPCDLSYYRRAVEYIARAVPNPRIFVFSDDPGWVQQNLQLSLPMTMVSHQNHTEDFEELHLMSRCRHHIIANSTFSWWGAWLNSNRDKIVVAPKQWYRKESGVDLRDRVPSEWVQL